MCVPLYLLDSHSLLLLLTCARAIPTAYKFTCCSLASTRLYFFLALVSGAHQRDFHSLRLSFGFRKKRRKTQKMLRHVSVWVLHRKKHFFTSSTTILTPTGAYTHPLFSSLTVVPSRISKKKGPTKLQGPLGKRLLKKAEEEEEGVCAWLSESAFRLERRCTTEDDEGNGDLDEKKYLCKKRTRPVYRFSSCYSW